MNLRRRFERIIEEVEQTREDLRLHRTKADELYRLISSRGEENGGGGRQQTIDDLNTSIGNAAARSIHQLAKNASETAALEQSFREILEELVNNAVHTEEMVGRIEGLIVEPLKEINERDFNDALSAVNLFKQRHDAGSDTRPHIDSSIERIDVMLDNMRKVLSEMQDLVKFHEAIQNLEEIIKAQNELRQQTEEERKRKAIEALKRLGLD